MAQKAFPLQRMPTQWADGSPSWRCARDTDVEAEHLKRLGIELAPPAARTYNAVTALGNGNVHWQGTMDKIAKWLHVSPSTVRRSLPELCAKNFACLPEGNSGGRGHGLRIHLHPDGKPCHLPKAAFSQGQAKRPDVAQLNHKRAEERRRAKALAAELAKHDTLPCFPEPQSMAGTPCQSMAPTPSKHGKRAIAYKEEKQLRAAAAATRVRESPPHEAAAAAGVPPTLPVSPLKLTEDEKLGLVELERKWEATHPNAAQRLDASAIRRIRDALPLGLQLSDFLNATRAISFNSQARSLVAILANEAASFDGDIGADPLDSLRDRSTNTSNASGVQHFTSPDDFVNNH